MTQNEFLEAVDNLFALGQKHGLAQDFLFAYNTPGETHTCSHFEGSEPALITLLGLVYDRIEATPNMKEC